jgi:hypothetical protein
LSYAATPYLFPVPAFAQSEQALLAKIALTYPNTHSNWSLGCWEQHTASQTLTTFDKNGVSGQGGFGAWVRLAQSAPSLFPTAGVLVVQNRAEGPTEFSRRVLDYLLGDTTSKWPTKSVESQEPVEDSDPVV